MSEKPPNIFINEKITMISGTDILGCSLSHFLGEKIDKIKHPISTVTKTIKSKLNFGDELISHEFWKEIKDINENNKN